MTSDLNHTSETTLPSLLTITQTAMELQVSTKTIRRWIDAGDLIAHGIGRQFRISEADLMAFIRTRREG